MDEQLRQLKQLADSGDMDAAQSLALIQFKLINHHVLDFSLKLIDLIGGQLTHTDKFTRTGRTGYIPIANQYSFHGSYNGFPCLVHLKVPLAMLGEPCEEDDTLACSAGVNGMFYMNSEPNISGSFEFGGSFKITDPGWGTILDPAQARGPSMLRGPIKVASARKPYKRPSGKTRMDHLRQSKEISLVRWTTDPKETAKYLDYYYHPEKLLKAIADIIKPPEDEKMRRNPGEEELRKLEQLAEQGDPDAQEKYLAMLRHMGLCQAHKIAGCKDCICEKHKIDNCDDCFPETLEWDTYEIAKSYAEHLQSENPGLSDDQAFDQASSDQDLYEIEFESICEILSGWMDELNPKSDNWVAVASGVGWRRLSGRKEFTATNGLEFLRQILPNTENTYTIRRYRNRKHLEMSLSNHDSLGSLYYIYPQTVYTISQDPSSWALRSPKGGIVNTPSFDEVAKAIDELEKKILEKWPYLTIETVRDGEWGDKPIGGKISGTQGDEVLISEIDDFVEDNWENIIKEISPVIDGYHDCNCCGEVVMGQSFCNACKEAGCEGGEKDCQVQCNHSDYRVENGIKICNDCGLGEDGSEHRRNPKKRKKVEQWFDDFLKGEWFRGTDAKNKGVGVAYMGEGLYLTWDRNFAQAFADLAVAKSKKGPAKIHSYRLKPNLNILDNQSEEMINFKQSLGIAPWDKIDSKILARALTNFAKEKGYHGIIDDNPADGLVIFDPKNVEQI